MLAYHTQSRVRSPAQHKLGVVVPEDVEEGGSEVRGHLQPQTEFMVSLGYLRHRKNKKKGGRKVRKKEGRKQKERNYVLKLGGRIGFFGKTKNQNNSKENQN